jgi:hypothetical protein
LCRDLVPGFLVVAETSNPNAAEDADRRFASVSYLNLTEIFSGLGLYRCLSNLPVQAAFAYFDAHLQTAEPAYQSFDNSSLCKLY